jgi:hypothetical protein
MGVDIARLGPARPTATRTRARSRTKPQVASLAAAETPRLRRRGACSRRAFVAAAALAATGGLLRGRLAAANPAPTAVQLRRSYARTYGDACVTQVVAATANGKICALFIDDYIYMPSDQGYEPVPCSDEAFGDGAREGYVLVSKRQNNELYSAAMREQDSAAQSWLDSVEALERYSAGKAPQELYGVDAVAGCTFVSPQAYLIAAAQAAGGPYLTVEGSYVARPGVPLRLARATGAAWAGEAFGDAVVLYQEDTAVLTSYDELCYLPFDLQGANGMPNSDAAFGACCASGLVLASKAVNNQAYSRQMAAQGAATQDWGTSVAAIQAETCGLTAEQVARLGVDTATGSTLESTALIAQIAAEALAEGPGAE